MKEENKEIHNSGIRETVIPKRKETMEERFIEKFGGQDIHSYTFGEPFYMPNLDEWREGVKPREVIDFISQERKRWEDELREKVKEKSFNVNVAWDFNPIKVIRINDVLSLLGSGTDIDVGTKEEECKCTCHSYTKKGKMKLISFKQPIACEHCNL